ncbi:trans-2-enoyl-CoA reductase [NADH] [Erysipelotrichaceae bacterium]|nr:trans-2-enoyl-CoA reductase [NADH] [Erysipelotrichaceae bacterium]
MIIRPSIRMNVSFNAHPLGLQKYVTTQADYMLAQKQFSGVKKALIIGGSTGYGLATRLCLALSAKADTISISYEVEPMDKKTGSAGFWNNTFAAQAITASGVLTKDFLGDAFSTEMKQAVADYIKKDFGGKIDLLVYSLASGRRTDPTTGITYNSTLKVMGEPLVGNSLDINSNEMLERKIDAASSDEIANTIKVMGGEDWQLWIEFLLEHDLLAENFKTVTYSYIGPKATERIYRDGTIGMAKEHMEATATQLNILINEKLGGEALSAVCRAAVTRASSVIPIFPLYSAALTKVMEQKGIDEVPYEHIYRLFSEMIYGENRELDEKGRVRPDNWELRSDVQDDVNALLKNVTKENLHTTLDTQKFISLFLEQNGFGFADINYENDVDIDALKNTAIYEKI